MNSATHAMSVRETSVWASLATTVLIYVVFFAATVSGAVRGSDQIGLLIGLVIAQIVALIGFQILLALLRGVEKPDERDTLIELRSFRYGYVVLSFGVATVTLAYIAWGGIAAEPDAASAGVSPPTVALVGNAILLCFVAAEIAKSATQVILYRRGVGGL